MSNGQQHEHITNLRCKDDDGKFWNYTVDLLVAYIKKNGDNSVWCAGTGGVKSAWVYVASNGQRKYVRTKSDGNWSNNLLALPTF